MLKSIQKLMALLFKQAPEHKHEVVDQDKVKLKRDLGAAQRDLVSAQKENTFLAQRHGEVKEQLNLWMRKSGDLQDKLSASLGHTTVLEGVLEESNRTIESLQLALELREKEETEGLQNYIDDLEAEIDEAVSLITKYGLQMRKM